MKPLKSLFSSRQDEICNFIQVGDKYMAVSGLPEPCAEQARCIARLALDMMDLSMQVAVDGISVVGINSTSSITHLITGEWRERRNRSAAEANIRRYNLVFIIRRESGREYNFFLFLFQCNPSRRSRARAFRRPEESAVDKFSS